MEERLFTTWLEQRWIGYKILNMAAVIEIFESTGIASEADLGRIYELDKPAVTALYERVYEAADATELAESESPSTDPFSFIASASLRGEAGCSSPVCRVEKLNLLGRYAALYANRLTFPLPLEQPSKVTDVDRARYLLAQTGLSLLSLRPLVDAGIVVPRTMTTHHCEHTLDSVMKMIDMVHSIADEAAGHFARQFRVVYQSPQKSPTGRSTLYIKGPEEFLEHGDLVMLFDEGPKWRAKSWKLNRVGRVEIGGRRKRAAVTRIFNQIANDTTFYFAHGGFRTSRYLTDLPGEAFLLDFLMPDEELAATSAALAQYATHTVPLLGDLPLGALVRIRREERESFGRYQVAVRNLLSEISSKHRRPGKAEVQDIFKEQIEPELVKMKSELKLERKRQRRRIGGALAALATSIGIGAFGLAPVAGAALAAPGAVVGSKLLYDTAKSVCEHGANVAGGSDFYFLLRITEEAEKA